jgi:hypothetical protein
MDDTLEELPLQERQGFDFGLVPSFDSGGNNQVIDALLGSVVGPGGDADGLAEAVGAVSGFARLSEESAEFTDRPLDFLASFALGVRRF